jgi:thymidylate synthase
VEIHGSTGQAAYPRVIHHVLETGRTRTVRGLETVDAGFTTILLRKPYEALPLGVGRSLSKAIAAVEALQLIGGFSAPSLVVKIAPNFERYLNGDGFHGAYGSRIKHQAAAVVTRLRQDEQSRQAVITLWDPYLDNLPDMNDYPCTVALQFQVENGCLCMNVVMRSNDAWLGLPYDMFQFAQLQMSLARSLDLADGWYRHTALSLHLYVTDAQKANDVLAFQRTRDGQFQPMGVGKNKEDFPTIMKTARRLSSGGNVDEITLSEEWYRDVLASYVG